MNGPLQPSNRCNGPFMPKEACRKKLAEKLPLRRLGGDDRCRQRSFALEERVDGGRAGSTLGDRPHDELCPRPMSPATNTPCDVGDPRVVALARCRGRRVRHRRSVSRRRFSGPTKPMASRTRARAGTPARTLDGLELMPPSSNARPRVSECATLPSSADESLGVDGVDPLAALLVRRADAVDHRYMSATASRSRAPRAGAA